jgi:hypothetical protein
MTTTVQNIENFRRFFPDEKAFRAFATEFEGMFSTGLTAFFAGSRIVGGILTAEATKELLYARLREKIVTRPQLLAEMVESLESDDIVD